MDVLSRYLFAHPTQDVTAKAVARCNIDVMTKHCFLPTVILTDKGSQFRSEVELNHHSQIHRKKPSTVSTQKFVSKKNAQSDSGTASTSDVKPNCNETQRNQAAEGFCAKTTNTSNVLFSTAMVKIQDHSGKHIQMRALLDSGSQASFIT